MAVVSVSGLGQFGKRTAYLIGCFSEVPFEQIGSPSFQVPGFCQSIWIRPELGAALIQVDLKEGFCLDLHKHENTPSGLQIDEGGMPGQPLPPVVIKGNGYQGGFAQEPSLAPAPPSLHVDITPVDNMKVQVFAPQPPFTTEFIITSDLATYDGYKIDIQSADGSGVIEIKGTLLPGFEISFVLVPPSQ